MMSERANSALFRKKYVQKTSEKYWLNFQLREVQEQLAYLTDLQARLLKAGRRKKKKEGLGAGTKGGKKDGEG